MISASTSVATAAPPGGIFPKWDRVIERQREIADAASNPTHSATPQQHDVMTPDQFKSEMIGLLPRLRRFAISLTRSGPDADDLLQEACTTALQRWQQYDPSQPFDRWMFRVVRNLWISEIRKRKVRQGAGQIDAADADELQTPGAAEDAVTVQQVRQKVADLDQDLAQPLMLVCAEGYSYKEAAELLSIPIGTVMSRIHRARKLLVSGLTAEESVPQ